MKHAGAAALGELAELLDQIRTREGLKEKKPGIFYRRSKPCLHFHEDKAGLFADLSTGDGFERYPVNIHAEQRAFISALDRALAVRPS